MWLEYFNTSHVNVNPSIACILISLVPISIHLMLMLITDKALEMTGRVAFQYISC